MRLLVGQSRSALGQRTHPGSKSTALQGALAWQHDVPSAAGARRLPVPCKRMGLPSQDTHRHGGISRSHGLGAVGRLSTVRWALRPGEGGVFGALARPGRQCCWAVPLLGRGVNAGQ